MGEEISRNKFLLRLVENLYSRNDIAPMRSNFRVKGDTVDVFLAYVDHALRIVFWGDEIEEIYTFDPLNNKKMETFQDIDIFPANIFVTSQDTINQAIGDIEIDLGLHVEFLKKEEQKYKVRLFCHICFVMPWLIILTLALFPIIFYTSMGLCILLALLISALCILTLTPFIALFVPYFTIRVSYLQMRGLK